MCGISVHGFVIDLRFEIVDFFLGTKIEVFRFGSNGLSNTIRQAQNLVFCAMPFLT